MTESGTECKEPNTKHKHRARVPHKFSRLSPKLFSSRIRAVLNIFAKNRSPCRKHFQFLSRRLAKRTVKDLKTVVDLLIVCCRGDFDLAVAGKANVSEVK